MSRKFSSAAFALALLVAGVGVTEVLMLAQEQTQAIERQVIRKLAPQYPEIARRFRITGKVKVQIVIGVDGRVKSIRALGGHPILLQSVEDAVKKWQFAPNVAESTQIVAIEFAKDEVR